MRLLWMGASETVAGPFPPDERASGIASRVLGAATGEPVDLVVRRVWPSPDLPAVVEGWLARYRPELVQIAISTYPTCYASVPIRLERAFGAPGKAVGRAGLTVIGEGWLPHHPGFRAARWLARHTIGAAAYFEPEELVSTWEAVFRAVLRTESAGLVVIPSSRPLYVDTGRDEAYGRWLRLRDGIFGACARLHVRCPDLDADQTDADLRAERDRHGLELSALGHDRRGRLAGAALYEAWQELAPALPASSPR
ncbi:MAG: hypothetical protein IT304_05125 [Dehalococcoidia bacterium]|nr:hypothetical protein [Dehalococcoidia bacterium]